MVTPLDVEGFDLRALPASFYENPYPTYRKLQSEHPVFSLPGGGYFVSSYDLARQIYRDTSNFSSDKRLQFAGVYGEDSPLFEHHTTALVFRDPPLHTQVRRAIGNALSQRMVDVMRTSLQTIVDGLVDRLAQKGQADLIAEYAGAIPVEIIGNLLGVPEEEREPLRAWSLAILKPLEVDVSPEEIQAGEAAVTDFIEYLKHLIERRQRTLDETDDILARLLKWEHEGQRLTPSELYHQCIFLLNAGHETTTNLIGNGIELFTRFPNALSKLLAEPSLINPAVEEILRYESSNQLGNRTTTSKVSLGGIDIEKDIIVTIGIGAANRDPSVFPSPDDFDITRDPNPHLAFGGGIHTCAGLNVARLEGQIALLKLFQRFPNLELLETPQRDRRARFRGFTSLCAKVH